MARYAYDVNNTQRYIDVHKQFTGGLKTVDTDDSLGAVFLRDAENVSLSEFGFIEKRYGTFENFKAGLEVSLNSNLQGYWEFLGKYIIVALNGKIFYQLLTTPTASFTEITTFYKKDGLKYPANLNILLNLTESEDGLTLTNDNNFVNFQDSRPMGAANIANVLYIFTGKYPIYIVEENDELKAYLFAKDEPVYAELVVTGHNLLEDDYDNLYYGDILNPTNVEVLPEDSEDNFVFKDHTYAPLIPYAKDGELSFNISYDYQSTLGNTFELNTTTKTPFFINELSLTNIEARPSGAGATDLSYTSLAPNTFEANTLNNIKDSIDYPNLNVIDSGIANFTDIKLVENTNYSVTDIDNVTINEKYWSMAIAKTPGWSGSEITLHDTSSELFRIKARDFQLSIDNFDASQVYMTDGNTLAISIQSQPGNLLLDLETKLQQARDAINPYLKKDTRTPNLKAGIFSKDSSLYYYLAYEAGPSRTSNATLMPIYIKNPLNNVTQEQINNAKISYDLVTSRISTGGIKNLIRVHLDIPTYDNQDLVIETVGEYVQYKENGVWKNLYYEDLQYPTAISPEDRLKLQTIMDKVNVGTTVSFELHTSSQTHAAEPFVTYQLGEDNFKFENGYYLITLPDSVPNLNLNHYEIVFKTVDVEFTGIRTKTFVNQTPTSGTFYFNSGSTASLENTVVAIQRDRIYKYLLPHFSQLAVFPQAQNYEVFSEQTSATDPTDTVYKTYTVYEVNSVLELNAQSEFGQFLTVKLKDDLLSGTYDFRLTYELKRQQLSYTTFSLSDVSTPEKFYYTIKGITVTEEKLTDYTFFQEDRAHPIWSCNNVIEHFNKLMVWGSTEMPTSLFYSFPDRPFYFPSDFYLEFTNEENKPLVNVTPFMNILVAQTEDQTWGIRGNSGLLTAPSPYAEFSINNTVGTIAPKSVRPVRNHLFFLSKQGIIALKSLYAADEQYNIDFVDRNIRNIVPQDSKAVGIQFDNQYWLNFPNDRITLRWYIDKKAWVKDVYNGWDDFNGVFKYQIKDGKLEFITHPSDYDGREFIYKVGIDYSLPTDISTPIVAKFETSFLNQNYPFHPKNYKETKLDFTLQNEYNQSRDAIYSMDDNEDMPSKFLHIVDNADVVPNHAYKLQYYFDPKYNELDAGTFLISYDDVYDGGDFNTNTYTPVGSLEFSDLIIYDGGNFTLNSYDTTSGGDFNTNLYRILGNIKFVENEFIPVNESFNHLVIESVVVKEYNTDVSYPVYELTIGEDYLSFQMPNEIKGNKVDIEVVGNFINYIGGADLYDVTYDNALNFKTWIMSEDQTLNFDNIDSYDQSKADVGINFNDRLGTWTFGTSDFGKKVTAVKTIKLSGKGYNSKIYMEDYSKSKWTLESIGLTYKMKRARSR